MIKHFVPNLRANAALSGPLGGWPAAGWSVATAAEHCRIGNKTMQMTIWDLVKATIVCGGLAFVVYSYPALSQAIIIGLLTLMWFSCAHQVVKSARR